MWLISWVSQFAVSGISLLVANVYVSSSGEVSGKCASASSCGSGRVHAHSCAESGAAGCVSGGRAVAARRSGGERGVRPNAGGCIPLPRRPQVKCHQTAFRNIWNDLYGAKESGRGAGRGAARPWDSGARASRTAPPPRSPHRAASRIPARLPPNLFSRDPPRPRCRTQLPVLAVYLHLDWYQPPSSRVVPSHYHPLVNYTTIFEFQWQYNICRRNRATRYSDCFLYSSIRNCSLSMFR